MLFQSLSDKRPCCYSLFFNYLKTRKNAHHQCSQLKEILGGALPPLRTPSLGARSTRVHFVLHTF